MDGNSVSHPRITRGYPSRTPTNSRDGRSVSNVSQNSDPQTDRRNPPAHRPTLRQTQVGVNSVGLMSVGMSWLALAVEDVLIHLVHNRPSDISSNLFKNERKLLIGGW